jgi:hypothetical protein
MSNKLLKTIIQNYWTKLQQFGTLGGSIGLGRTPIAWYIKAAGIKLKVHPENQTR